MTDNKTPWVIIGLAGLCLLCLVPALVLGSTAGNRAGDAVTAALASDGGADSDQQVTAVCVGLFSGSCNVDQTSTTTATRPEARPAAPSPWQVIAVISGLVLLAVVAALVLFKAPGGES
jgi:hypothetical protein